jgi:hypothetical protein
MSRCRLLAVLTTLAVSAGTASAEVIIQYDTQGVGGGAPTVSSVAAINPAAGVTGVAVTRGPGLTPVSASFAINASGWNDLGSGDYFQFGFTTTQPIDVDRLTVGLQSSATGPGFVRLLYSRDGGAFTPLASAGSIAITPAATLLGETLDLNEIGVVNSSLLLRFVVDAGNPVAVNGGAIGSAGTFRFGSFSPSAGVFVNPEITGAAVPEPASIALAGLGVALVLGARASRWRAAA